MLTKELCNRIVNYPLNEIPPDVIHEAKRSFLNWLSVAIGACNHPSVDMVLAVANSLGGNPQATILGRRVKTTMLFSSLINGMSSHIFDFDDTLLDTVLHPSAPVIPAALAWCEHHELSGKAFLQSSILGIEVAQRIAQAICPSHYDRGWHVTGTAGTFGSATAVGRLMNLDEEHMIYALGLSSSQSTGLREMFGTMTKPFHPGKAAANGLLAAMLAQKGFTSSPQALEAQRGYLNVLSENYNPSPIKEVWGEHWKIMANTYKPFACGIVTHPAIDAAISLHKDGITAKDIKHIILEAHPLVQELTGKFEPTDSLQAKFSVYHCTAVGLIDGAASEKQFATNKVCDPHIINLRRKISLTVNENLTSDQARLKVNLINGTTIEKFVEHAVGSLANPLSDNGLEEKFRALTNTVLSTSQQNDLIALVWDLEKLHSIKSVIAKI